MKGLTPRQRDRRRKIFIAVRNLLSRHGYEGLNMRSAAKDAGVSPTTLYNLFDSKDSLVLAALQDMLADLGAEITAAEVQGIARLEQHARITARQVIETPQFAEAITRTLLNAQPDTPISEYFFSGTVSNLILELEAMQASGEVRADIDLDLLARSIVANHWTTLLMWSKGFIALLELPDELTRTLINTVLPAMSAKEQKRWQKPALY